MSSLTHLQDEQRELAKTIRVSGSILLSTVSNFLDFFKMEAGKALDIVRTEVDVQVPRCTACLSCCVTPACIRERFACGASHKHGAVPMQTGVQCGVEGRCNRAQQHQSAVLSHRSWSLTSTA